MLLCGWNLFYASLDKSVQREMLLCGWNLFYASLDESVRRGMLLCGWRRMGELMEGTCFDWSRSDAIDKEGVDRFILTCVVLYLPGFRF